MPKPAIIVHGGAGSIEPVIWTMYKRQAHVAAGAGQQVLDRGGSAIDAAIEAVRFMEDDPTFNAGIGSCLTWEGGVENDAIVMRDDLESGAVGCITGIRNPVLAARLVLEETPHQLMVGPGAVRFALDHGLKAIEPIEMVIERRRQRLDEMIARGEQYDENPETDTKSANLGLLDDDDETSDTVGACAIDAHGRLAAASSTGGVMGKLPGRCGDVPAVGCGTYCGPAGAVTCTGHGESAMRVCLAKYTYDLLERGVEAGEAARLAIDYLVDRVDGKCGLVLIDAQGNRGWATSTYNMSLGLPEQEMDSREGCLKAVE